MNTTLGTLCLVVHIFTGDNANAAAALAQAAIQQAQAAKHYKQV